MKPFGYMGSCLGTFTVNCDECNFSFKTARPEEWFLVDCPAGCDSFIVDVDDLIVLIGVRKEARKQRLFKLLMPWRKRAIFNVDSSPLRKGEPVSCVARAESAK